MVPDDKSVGKKLADDAMYKLEHVGKDKNKMADVAPRLVGVYDIQEGVCKTIRRKNSIILLFQNL